MSGGLEEHGPGWHPSKGDDFQNFEAVGGFNVPRETREMINGLSRRPDIKQYDERHWFVKFPVEMGGLLLKASSIDRPIETPSGETHVKTTYSLSIERFTQMYGIIEPGAIDREELTSLRDFLNAILEDSEV